MANGNTLPEQIATAEGGVIYFTGPAGTYTVMRKDAGAVRQPVEAEVTAQEIPIKIKVGTKYIYSDVDPVTVNDRTLLPMRALFENIGAQVEYERSDKFGDGDGRHDDGDNYRRLRHGVCQRAARDARRQRNHCKRPFYGSGALYFGVDGT